MQRLKNETIMEGTVRENLDYRHAKISHWTDFQNEFHAYAHKMHLPPKNRSIVIGITDFTVNWHNIHHLVRAHTVRKDNYYVIKDSDNKIDHTAMARSVFVEHRPNK